MDRMGEAKRWMASLPRDQFDLFLILVTERESDGWERGMRDAANICGTLSETTYDDADSFEAATGCEAAIRADMVIHKKARP